MSNHSGEIANAKFLNITREIVANSTILVHFTFTGTDIKNRNTRLDDWISWDFFWNLIEWN